MTRVNPLVNPNLELAPQLPHVVRHAEAVRHGADPVLEGLQPRLEGQLGAGVSDESLAEVVAAVADEVEDAPHRVLGEEGLLVLGCYIFSYVVTRELSLLCMDLPRVSNCVNCLSIS